jgi:imidazolonepropionase-like amidohydrolase
MLNFKGEKRMRILRGGLLAAVAVMVAGCAAAQAPGNGKAGGSSADLVLQGGRVIASPMATPIENATVVLHDGKIVAVGTAAQVKVPAGAKVIDCKGDTIVAGFWNNHVHFMEPVWNGAALNPAAPMQTHLEDMLTRWGFVTVWDLGSNPMDLLPLRQRIEAGELRGPRIFIAGDIFPKGGHPVYIPADVPLLEAASPEEAAGMASDYLKQGADGIKLFTGAYMGEHPVINMDTTIVKAAVDVAHAAGKPVFAHPQNYAGVNNALAGGVDVLAHTIPVEHGYTADELARMKAQKTALTPTLTLWRVVMADEEHAPAAAVELMIQRGADELKSFAAQGGTVLFGTDVGYIHEYDTTHEMEYMGRVLGWREILASLTATPCDYFKQTHCGRVEVGDNADVVVLTADPAVDVRNFAKVAYTVRNGKVIFAAK